MSVFIKKIFFIFLLIINYSIYSKVLIITTAYNQIDFIELQYKSFKKFLKEDFEYLVFNDAPDVNIAKSIEEQCKKLGVECITFPQEQHKAKAFTPPDFNILYNPQRPLRSALRHGDVVDFAFKLRGFNHPDIVVLIDLDMFLVYPISIRELLGDHEVAGIKFKRYPFLKETIGAELAIFNMPKLPYREAIELRPGLIGYTFVDTFAFLQFYFVNNPQIKIKFLNEEEVRYLTQWGYNRLIELGYSGQILNFLADYIKIYGNNIQGLMNDPASMIEKKFLNYRASTWFGYEIKDKYMKNFLKSYLN